MAIKIYNTLTKRKEEFLPLKEGKVGMYVCGVTVYDFSHIGHARAMIVFDVIYRYLCYKGYEVTYVRNYTDIDDKIIKKANEEGISTEEIAQRYIKEFDKDMEALRVKLPTYSPKATEHIREMIEMIEILQHKGYAYQIEGDVYFRVNRFSDYGKLSGKRIEELRAGARIEVDERKEDPLDFALWKKSKPGEPFWESPWGKGRPGWHIECSVMSQKYLGETFDIHGGGMDLIFPHHENEIAQSEAATGKPFVRYWIHNGFVRINKEKMSKSLGNIFTIREVLQKWHPEVLRLFFLSYHYRSPVEYSEENLSKAKLTLDRFYSLLKSLKEMESEAKENSSQQDTILKEIETLHSKFEQAMDDDFNTAKALAVLNTFVREVNREINTKGCLSKDSIQRTKMIFNSIGDVFGIFLDDPDEYFDSEKKRKLAILGISEQEITRLIEERSIARKKKDWRKADAIREELSRKGIILEDTPKGTIWKVS